MKGINLNTRPQEQPKDTYRFAKNGISNDPLMVEGNEPGFKLMADKWPYVYNGFVRSDKHPIIFSTNNVNSAIGYFDVKNETYIPILDDATLPFKLGFNVDWYITGQAQRNSNNEVVVAFTNKHNVAFYLNCDNPDVNTLADLYLFPRVGGAGLEITQDSGGVLSPGAYFASVRYSKQDGTITGFVGISQVTVISGAPNTTTDRSLIIEVTNVDTNYDYIELAIIQKVGGVFTTPQLLSPVSVTNPTMRLVYTGGELTTDIALESILIPSAVYTRVGTMGQLNDALYIGNLETEPPIRMQPWVNLINVRWKSQLIDVINLPEDHKQGKTRHFLHEEVYALYIQFSKVSGGWTPWFTIPGRTPQPADLAISADAAAQGITAQVFQVEDTCTNIDTGTFSGDTGIWANESESYPNEPDYDSSAIGGRDLRGEAVLHHRMPSIALCRSQLYDNAPYQDTYGKTKMDLLGIELTNVIIPTEYADKINGWRVGFAKRTTGNSLIQGQGLVLHAAQEGAWNGGTPMITGTGVKYVSTGGNFDSGKQFVGAAQDMLVLDKSTLRFHSFDMLFNKPAVSGNGFMLSNQLVLRRDNLETEGFMEDFNLGNSDTPGPTVMLIDYTQPGNNAGGIPSDVRIRRLIDPLRAENNIVTGPWYNKDLESAYVAKLSEPIDFGAWTQSLHLVSLGADSQTQSGIPNYEVTMLANILRLRTNCYAPFFGQKIIVASETLFGTSGVCFGGDSYLGDYTFHTYGWYTKDNETKDPDIGGTKIVRRFICENAANLSGRFEDIGNIYSKWYPRSPLSKDDAANYITEFNIRQDPNQFGYSKDSNTLNELSVDTGVFYVLQNMSTKHPFRIARGGKLGRQDKTRSWRTWVPLDYYENVKTFGEIINIDGQDDRLLIHMEKALMITQDKTKLESDILSITLGSGDIFQFEPQDAESAPHGYAGTIHDLSCHRSPMGYFFVDSPAGEAFLFKKNLDPMGRGLLYEFRELLKVDGRNPLQGDGITVGYDPKYRRLLLTVKRTKPPQDTDKVIYYPTDEQLAAAQIGDLFYMHDRILRYDGPNIPLASGFACDSAELSPQVSDFSIDIASGVYNGEAIGVVNGLYVQTVLLTGVVPATSLFGINPSTREILVYGTLDANIISSWQLNIRATSAQGIHTDIVVTVNVLPW